MTQTATGPRSGKSLEALRDATLRWVDDRLGLTELTYDVPRHANNVLYVLGGITFAGILLLIASGIYLAQYYNPDPASARDSVVFIVQTARFGEFVRSFHFWMANLVIIAALLHLVRVFVTGAYRPPREGTWLTGVVLLFILFGFAFTGTVLKWDQEGYEALQHNQDVGKLLGSTGAWFTSSFARSVPILTRLYIAHISILPALLTLLLVAHFFLVKHHGISGLPGHEPERRGETDTEHAIEDEGAAPFSAHLRLMTGFGLMHVRRVRRTHRASPCADRPAPQTPPGSTSTAAAGDRACRSAPLRAPSAPAGRIRLPREALHRRAARPVP